MKRFPIQIRISFYPLDIFTATFKFSYVILNIKWSLMLRIMRMEEAGIHFSFLLPPDNKIKRRDLPYLSIPPDYSEILYLYKAQSTHNRFHASVQ